MSPTLNATTLTAERSRLGRGLRNAFVIEALLAILIILAWRLL